MAIAFLNNISFSGGAQAQSLRLENLPSDPGSGNAGQLYYDTANTSVKVYNGSAWVEISGGVTSVTTTDGSYINLTPNSATTGDVTVTADLSADGTANNTTYLRGDNTWAALPADENDFLTGLSFETSDGILTATVQNQSNVTVDLDGRYALSGDIPTVNNSQITIGAGTYLSLSTGEDGVFTLNQATGENITLNHDNTNRTDTESTDTPGYGGNFEAVTSVTTNDQGHVTAIDVSTVTLPSAESYTWTLGGDSGTGQSIGSGDTATFLGGTNITTVVNDPAGDNLTINLDDSITLAGTLTVNGTGDSSFAGDIAMNSNSITGLVNPTNDQDAATKAYVDSLVEGGLTFKDGFNADTGAIDGGGNLTTGASRVAISVGDYYVVTTAGDFYGDSSIPLTVGDSVIAKEDAAAGASTSADWVIVQGDEGVVDLTSGNGGNSTGNAITSNTTARGSVTVNSFAYNGGTNVGHVPSGGSATTFLRGDGTWVTPTDTQPPVTDVTASTANDELGISVSPTTGNVVVGIDINGMSASLGQDAAADDLLIIYDKSATQNKKVKLDNLLELIGVNRSKRIDLNNSVSGVSRGEPTGGVTTFTINVETIFGSGTIAQNVMCEVIGNIQNEGDTVYADIGRGPESGSDSNEMTVAFLGAVADGDYQVLLNRIGEFEVV